jgi:hypothetical protein
VSKLPLTVGNGETPVVDGGVTTTTTTTSGGTPSLAGSTSVIFDADAIGSSMFFPFLKHLLVAHATQLFLSLLVAICSRLVVFLAPFW